MMIVRNDDVKTSLSFFRLQMLGNFRANWTTYYGLNQQWCNFGGTGFRLDAKKSYPHVLWGREAKKKGNFLRLCKGMPLGKSWNDVPGLNQQDQHHHHKQVTASLPPSSTISIQSFITHEKFSNNKEINKHTSYHFPFNEIYLSISEFKQMQLQNCKYLTSLGCQRW